MKTITSMAVLSEHLQLESSISDDKKLERLQTWCHQHISNDTVYQGNAAQQYIAYLRFVTHYYDYFLTHLPPQLEQSVPALKHLNPVQYAACYGYDRYLAALDVSSLPADMMNTPASTGMRPLHLAAVNGHVQTVHTLLEQGADPALLNRQLQLPVDSALMVPMLYDQALVINKEAIFNALCARVSTTLTHQDYAGDSVLHFMASASPGSDVFVSLFKPLLEQNTLAAFCANYHSHYPIHTAILNNKPSIVHALLQIPGVAQLKDNQGRVALHYAANHASKDVFDDCLAAAPELLSLADDYGKTPEMLRAEVNRQSI